MVRLVLALTTAICVCSLVEAADQHPLTLEDLWKVKRVGQPALAPDGQWCAVEVTTWDMDKDESSSDIFLLATDGKTQRRLTNYPGKNSGPSWSPDGKHIAFTSKRSNDEGPQIYVISPDGGEARRLTNMPMAPSSLKWSADSKTVYCVAWTWPDAASDEAHKKKEKDLKESKVKAMIIDDAAFRYWDHFIADGKRPFVFSVDLATGLHRNLMRDSKRHLPPYEPSANDYDVSPDGTELCFVAENVKEIGLDVNHDLFTINLTLEKSPARCITADNPANDTSPVYAPDGKTIAFLRQTTKYFYADRTQLSLHDRETGKNRILTAEFDRSCANPSWFNDGMTLLFEAEDQGYVRLYTIVAKGGKPEAITSGHTDRAAEVWSRRQDDLVVFLRSSFDRPATVFSLHLGTRSLVQVSHFNDALEKTWKLGKFENVTVPGADDKPVQMWIVFPPDFDSAKRWPLVQIVHGGPHNGITTDFSFRWNPQLWAAQGWVIGIVNFHGSSGFGQAFTDSITGDLGDKPGRDIIKATEWFMAKPWIDKNRIATAGASYGGFMMAWLNGHTDLFKAMVCHAGVYNWHSMLASDIIRSRERSLGALPWGDLERIDRQSAQRYARNFKTPTLVIHGEKDYRVPVTQGFEYYNTLRQKGVPTRLLYYPDENHWILKAQNSRLWHKEVFGWLSKYIGNGPSK